MKVVTDAQPLTGGATTQTPTRAYRLMPGKRHTHDGRAMAAGDIAYLTRAQATAFSDRFEPVDADDDFEINDDETIKKGLKENSDMVDTATEGSGEFQQALKDKATAEAKAGGVATGNDPNGPTRTHDGARGTIHADPDGVADGRRAKKTSKTDTRESRKSEKNGKSKSSNR